MRPEPVKEDFKLVPISEATTPKSGNLFCYKNYYWYVVDECVLFYKGKYPQANTEKLVMEQTKGTVCKCFGEPEIRQLEYVFTRTD